MVAITKVKKMSKQIETILKLIENKQIAKAVNLIKKHDLSETFVKLFWEKLPNKNEFFDLSKILDQTQYNICKHSNLLQLEAFLHNQKS